MTSYLVHVLVHVLSGLNVRGLGADEQEGVALQGLELRGDVHALVVGLDVELHVSLVDLVAAQLLLELFHGLLLVLCLFQLKDEFDWLIFVS